jgi:hypothetical protein
MAWYRLAVIYKKQNRTAEAFDAASESAMLGNSDAFGLIDEILQQR